MENNIRHKSFQSNHNTVFGCIELGFELKNLEFEPPILLFGCAWNLGLEKQSNSEPRTRMCETALPRFGGRPLGISLETHSSARTASSRNRTRPFASELVVERRGEAASDLEEPVAAAGELLHALLSPPFPAILFLSPSSHEAPRPSRRALVRPVP
jgi:hypothetical protein